MRTTVHIPLVLTAIRALLAPLLILLALLNPDKRLFGVCLVAGFLSDVFDGIIARKLGVATPNLRRHDSLADSIFYFSAMYAAWHVHAIKIREYSSPLVVLLILELARYVFDYAKFRREASYHMWSSKIWGLSLFAGFFSLLALGNDGWPVALAIYLGIAADIEGLAISATLKSWRADVSSIFHALEIRRVAN